MNLPLKNLLIILGLMLVSSCKEESLEPSDSINSYDPEVAEFNIKGDTTSTLAKARLRDNQWIPTGSAEYGSGAYTMIGDFNSDGLEDIASPKGNEILIRFSQGLDPSSGDYDDFYFLRWNSVNALGNATYTFSGDFDGDGVKDDIASIRSGTAHMQLGRGTAFQPENWNIDNKWGASGWTKAGDFNGYGITDLVSLDGTTARMKFSDGSKFLHDQDWTIDPIYAPSSFVFAGDYNADGYDDIMYTDPSLAGPAYVSVIQSDGTRFYRTRHFECPSPHWWGNSSYVWVGDSNGDGGDEIITGDGDFLENVLVREYSNFKDEFETTPFWTGNKWGSSGYNWMMNIDGAQGDELVSGISDYLFVH